MRSPAADLMIFDMRSDSHKKRDRVHKHGARATENDLDKP